VSRGSTPPAPAWRRHQLVWLDDAGWHEVLGNSATSAAHDEQVRGCLAHWARQRWPLVVSTQSADGVDAAGIAIRLTLGLPAPERWGRRRIAVQVPTRAVARTGEFPLASRAGLALPAELRGRWADLCSALERLGLQARIYGSHGWQLLTGLDDHVRPGSDLDLLLPVADVAQADAACALLQQASFDAPRLDGELAFADGASVAWREWSRWRAGQTRSVLVKRIDGATLSRTPWPLACA
jgi:phosphoribosyl-dephospho-CoA transferase